MNITNFILFHNKDFVLISYWLRWNLKCLALLVSCPTQHFKTPASCWLPGDAPKPAALLKWQPCPHSPALYQCHNSHTPVVCVHSCCALVEGHALFTCKETHQWSVWLVVDGGCMLQYMLQHLVCRAVSSNRSHVKLLHPSSQSPGTHIL